MITKIFNAVVAALVVGVFLGLLVVVFVAGYPFLQDFVEGLVSR